MLLRAVSLCVALIFAGGVSALSPNGASSAQASVQSVDASSFFCSFACTPGACAVSRQVFERCKRCPQSQVSGCLMAASGVPIDAARTAMNAGTMLPPPGNCPAPDTKSGAKIKPLSSTDPADPNLGSANAEDEAEEHGDDEEDEEDSSDSNSSSEDEDSEDGEEDADAPSDEDSQE